MNKLIVVNNMHCTFRCERAFVGVAALVVRMDEK
jgi:hypothetical protein